MKTQLRITNIVREESSLASCRVNAYKIIEGKVSQDDFVRIGNTEAKVNSAGRVHECSGYDAYAQLHTLVDFVLLDSEILDYYQEIFQLFIKELQENGWTVELQEPGEFEFFDIDAIKEMINNEMS